MWQVTWLLLCLLLWSVCDCYMFIKHTHFANEFNFVVRFCHENIRKPTFIFGFWILLIRNITTYFQCIIFKTKGIPDSKFTFLKILNPLWSLACSLWRLRMTWTLLHVATYRQSVQNFVPTGVKFGKQYNTPTHMIPGQVHPETLIISSNLKIGKQF